MNGQTAIEHLMRTGALCLEHGDSRADLRSREQVMQFIQPRIREYEVLENGNYRLLIKSRRLP